MAHTPSSSVWRTQLILRDMAMGGGVTTRGSGSSTGSSGDDGLARYRPHAQSVPDGKSARSTPFDYLRRIGSRSMNEEYSTTSSRSDGSESTNDSVDGTRLRNSLPERTADASQMVRHGTDPHLDDRYYAMLRDSGNFVKMGWLTKQGHVWKNWKSRFFVLYHDGTLAYYKAKSKRRMKGCIKLNEGVVSIQHVDIRRTQKPYVFQVEKGFYRMWCCCCSQLEAELWVNALRDVRQSASPCYEPLLTVPEEQIGCVAVNRQLNKIFVKDPRIMSMLQTHKNTIVPHTIEGVYDVITRLENAILDRYQGFLYMDSEVELLSGNDLVKLLRRHVEDRAFIPTASFIYTGLENSKIRAARTRITRNVKLLKNKSQLDLGVPSDIAEISSDWKQAIVIINALDCMTLISHKIELIISAGDSITSRVTQFQGILAEVSDETLTTVFRYVLVHSSVDDIAILHALLKPVYLQHPACQNQSNIIAAFIDAIAWIDSYQVTKDDDASSVVNNSSLASARVEVSISTSDVGILFTTDGNGRGAIVNTVRKLSQAALSEKIVPGLSLIAINDEPVILMSFREICQRLRTAALPKRLTFLPEFFYYQLLSLDNEMYQYLLCLAAGRGDKDSVSWLIGSQLDVNELCSWEQTRGQQVLGFVPPSSRESPLHAAVHNGHHAMVEYLLLLGAKPNLEDRHGRTPLHLLSPTSLDMVPVIQELQSAGATLDGKDGEGVTPLMVMSGRGSLEGVTTLLALGARLDAVAWSSGYTALEYAVVYGAIEVAELLLSKGADPNLATLDGDTSVHLAAASGDANMLEILINAGGNANCQNRFGQVPAASILSHGSHRLHDSARKCLMILANAGSDIRKPDLMGRHLVHLAQLSNDDSVTQFVLSTFGSRDVEADCSVDIFGSTAQDYKVGHRRDLPHQRRRHPREFLSLKNRDLCGTSRDHSLLSRGKSFDDLMRSLLHDVSVDLADLLAFVMFLDSFSNVEAVVNYLRGFILNRSHGRNLLRFIVVLLLFKLRHAKQDDNIVKEIHSLLDHHRRQMSYNAVTVLDDYKAMFEQYFTLQGNPNCLKQYASLPIVMQHRYGGETASNFSSPFPRNVYIQVEASQWAEHCTLLTHTLFCSIPVDDFISVGSKVQHSPQFLSAKRWFQHLSAYVINAVLVEDTCEGRVEVINFFLTAAECCLTLRNYDTLAAILYALQSTAVQRLRRTLDCLSKESTRRLSKMQALSDKGCRDVNKLMHAAENPSMPYIGLYLQGFVGLNELPVFEKGDLINASRLRKMGELAVEILRRRSVAYNLSVYDEVDAVIHVQLPFASDETRYARSLQLEPREAGAAPLGERAASIPEDELDLDNEVRESIGSEGTFGIRQWFRMQKVVHRHRSRSATQPPVYEWV